MTAITNSLKIALMKMLHLRISQRWLWVLSPAIYHRVVRWKSVHLHLQDRRERQARNQHGGGSRQNELPRVHFQKEIYITLVLRFSEWNYEELSAFWATTPCSPVKVGFAACFRLVSCLVYSSTLKMEAICSSEKSVHFHRITCHYIPSHKYIRS
jgi:hypothetical protein